MNKKGLGLINQLELIKYKKQDQVIYKKLIIHFHKYKDILDFSSLIEQKVTNKTQFILFSKDKKEDINFDNIFKNKGLFDLNIENLENNKKESWEDHWQGMPEFNLKDLSPYKTIIVYFKTEIDLNYFLNLIKQKITKETKSLWYPKVEIIKCIDKRYINNEQINPKYPIYIISKGRWESRLTVKALESMNVPYYIVIEPQEYNNYAAVINVNKILVLPFKNLDQGSIPARNWVWEHSIGIGAKRHWILDDNIRYFFRFNRNLKVPVMSSVCFKVIEDYSDRYENIAISGMNYFMFVSRKQKVNPCRVNTRIYSNLLIKNDIDYRWRGKYNEDTDICIRVLKAGLCTILFNAFLVFKHTTMTMQGGNTEDLYKIENGRLKMAEALQKQHPDVVKVAYKWGRPQHNVNYTGFKRNKLKLKKNIQIQKGINNYGMVFQQLINNKWVTKEDR